MEYITTKEHPIFKEGIHFKINLESSYDLSAFRMTGISETFYESIVQCDTELWLRKGYIKEVEKPEFTKSDIADAVYSAHFSYESDYMNDGDAKQFVEGWIKNKAK